MMINPITIKNAEQLKEIGILLKENALKNQIIEKPVYSKTKKEAFERSKGTGQELLEKGIVQVLYYNEQYYTVVMTHDNYSAVHNYHLSMSLTLPGIVAVIDDATAEFFANNILGKNCVEKPDESPFGTIRNYYLEDEIK